MSYANISKFGGGVAQTASVNPLSYCAVSDLENSFNNSIGERGGPRSKSCQMFMSDYCANEWNDVCEYKSRDTNSSYPNMIKQCDRTSGACIGSGLGSQFTSGEMLVRNTAAKKYLTEMSAQCAVKYKPFDPLTASSVMVRYFEPSCGTRTGCVPVYEVNPSEIDRDPVMNKILDNPIIAMDVLVNIYNSSKRLGKLEGLKGTRIYHFFMTKTFQQYATASKFNADRRAYSGHPIGK